MEFEDFADDLGRVLEKALKENADFETLTRYGKLSYWVRSEDERIRLVKFDAITIEEHLREHREDALREVYEALFM